MLAIVVATVELGSLVAAKFIAIPRAPFLFFTPPEIDEAEWSHYIQVRDSLLGWPAREPSEGARYDSAGSRPVPSFPTPGGECVSLYGDSFTYGEEVRDAEAWGNVLAQLLGCRVANFGVPGYGTDQAYLRFALNSGDAAPISILGIYPQNVMRNVNQYRYLLSGTNPLGFKPRFVLSESGLQLVPIPELTFSRMSSIAERPGSVFSSETFLPNSDVGPIRARAPWTFVVVKMFFHSRFQNWVTGVPSWLDFMDPTHPSNALLITAEIADEFSHECERREKRCIILIFPSRSSYEFFQDTGELATAALGAELADRSLQWVALVPALGSRLGPRDFAELLAPGGHLNAEGNQYVAEIVAGHIAMLGQGDAQRPSGPSRPPPVRKPTARDTGAPEE